MSRLRRRLMQCNDLIIYESLLIPNNVWFDTEFVPTVNTRLESEFEITTGLNGWALYSNNMGDGSDTMGVRLFGYNDKERGLFAAFGANRASTLPLLTEGKYTIIQSHTSEYLTVNGDNTTYKTSIGTSLRNNTLKLFYDAYGDYMEKPYAYFSNNKFYSLKIYENDILIHWFVPCQYKGNTGIWDKITKKFYKNQGTKKLYPSDEYNYNIKYAIMYDYIQGTGTQYIDTKYYPIPSKTSFEITFIINNYNKTYDALCGSRLDSVASNSKYSVDLWLQNNNTLRVDAVTNNNGTFIQNINLNTLYTVFVDVPNNSVTINGTVYNYSTCTKSDVQNTNPFLLFNMAKHSYGLFNGNIYNFKLYNDGILVRNMSACNYDGENGMWDYVESKFYANSGTGTFTVENN